MTFILQAQPFLGACVDQESPFAQNLVGCWLLNDYSLLARNIAGNVPDSPMLLNGGTGLAVVPGTTGLALSQNGSSTGGVACSPLLGLAGAELTVIVVAAFAASNPTSNSPLAISFGTAQGVDTEFNLGIWSNQYLWWDMGNDYTYRPIPGGFNANAPVMIGAVLQRNLTRAFYFNGLRVGGEAPAKSLYAGNGGVSLMQQRAAQASNTSMNGMLYLAYVWTRALVPAEMAALAAEPYLFIVPPARQGTWFKPAVTSTVCAGAYRLSIGVGM